MSDYKPVVGEKVDARNIHDEWVVNHDRIRIFDFLNNNYDIFRKVVK